MTVSTIPTFENFGLDDAGHPVKRRRDGTWSPCRIILKGDVQYVQIWERGSRRSTSMSLGKFIFCASNQISPSAIDPKKYLFTKDLKLISRSEFCRKGAEVRESKKRGQGPGLILKEIKWLEAALDFYEGRPETITKMLKDHKDEMIMAVRSRCGVPASFAELCAEEAELQLFDALRDGKVSSPWRWVTKRAVGLCRDAVGKTAFRLSELPSK